MDHTHFRYVIWFFAVSILLMAGVLCFTMLYTPPLPENIPAGTITVSASGAVSRTDSVVMPVRPVKTVYRTTRGSLQYLFPAAADLDNPDAVYLPDAEMLPNGRLIPSERLCNPYLYPAVLCLILLLIGFYLFKNTDPAFTSPGMKKLFAVFFIAGTHFFLLALFRFQEPCVFVAEGDSRGYFAVINNILSGDFRTPCSYTAGLGILYLPFILLTGARTVETITPYVSLFSSVLVFPAAVCGTFLLAARYLKSIRSAFWGCAGWLIVSALAFITELPVQGGLFSPFGIFHCQEGFDYIYLVYRLVLTGFSQLSESWGYLFSVLAMLSAAKIRNPHGKSTVTGAVFAFACLIRINNIFFAPVIFWIFLQEDPLFFRKWKATLVTGCEVCAAFLAVFSIQFFLNHCYFGDFLCFPYCLHSKELYKGFRFSNLVRSGSFYFNCFAPLTGFCAAGLITCRDRRERTFLALAAIPMLLFFCGICEIGQNYRFLMPVYIFLVMGGMVSRVWKESSARDKWILGAALVLLTLPKWRVPFFLSPSETGTSPLGLLLLAFSWYFLPLCAVVCGYFLRKKQWWALLFLLIDLLFAATGFSLVKPLVFLLILLEGILFSLPGTEKIRMKVQNTFKGNFCETELSNPKSKTVKTIQRSRK